MVRTGARGCPPLPERAATAPERTQTVDDPLAPTRSHFTDFRNHDNGENVVLSDRKMFNSEHI
jgi:hypothetical protein